MKMADFKALSLDEQLLKLNKHLLSLKELPGRLEDNFKSGEFEFSYSLLKKNAKNLGIAVDGKNYTASMLDGISQQDFVKPQQEAEKQEDVMLQQDNVKQQQVNVKQNLVNDENLVKQQHNNVNDEELTLTKDEILFVKELFKNKPDVVTTQQKGEPLFMPQFMGAKKTTGISVYVELWERWGEFKKQHPMYSGTDLLALALEQFMERYDEGSDS